MGFLKEINANGTTIILTTHYLEEAEQLCKNIGIIDHGEIVVDTSMKDLCESLMFKALFLILKNLLIMNQMIEGYNLRLDDPLTLVTAVNKDKSINNLFDELNKIGIKVKSMRNESNRLEELFIETIKKKMNKNLKLNIGILWTLTSKEIRRFMRIWVQTLVPPAVTMTLYFVIFGSLIGPRIGRDGWI